MTKQDDAIQESNAIRWLQQFHKINGGYHTWYQKDGRGELHYVKGVNRLDKVMIEAVDFIDAVCKMRIRESKP